MATLGTFVAGQVLTAAELNAIGTPTNFTPSWTNLTVGNGTVIAQYVELNNLVFWRIQLTFGSTTSISGSVAVDYPFESSGGTFLGAVGGICTFDDASGADYWGALYRSNSSRANVMVQSTSGTYLSGTNINATTPFTWTTGDVLTIEDWMVKA